MDYISSRHDSKVAPDVTVAIDDIMLLKKRGKNYNNIETLLFQEQHWQDWLSPSSVWKITQIFYLLLSLLMLLLSMTIKKSSSTQTSQLLCSVISNAIVIVIFVVIVIAKGVNSLPVYS